MRAASINRLWGMWIAAIFLLNPAILAKASDFEVFDGHYYNGKFYPRVDVIEWNDNPGDPSYMDFHVYSKDKPLELSFQLEEKDNKKVMLVNYYFPDRKEHQCRRVLAPSHFTQGYMVYVDHTDPDYDSVVVSMYPMSEKKGRKQMLRPGKYASCEADEPARLPAGNESKPAEAGDSNDQKRTKPDAKGALKKSGQAVPFSDW